MTRAGYEAVIGLEVHAQLLTMSKLFCGCATEFGAEPNTQVCPVCLGLPGALPVPNREAIALARRAAVALGCNIAPRSIFARKNYFYPDLPKGYQISQYELPLAQSGKLAIETDDGEREVRINRVHMEEDAAKSLHGVGTGEHTLIDFNRGGVPLIEIVSEPDLRSAEEAESYLRALREILMAKRVNDGNLEEGSFRCDANVSVRPVGQTKLGTRAELKNINSFRFVRLAIEHEIARQIAVVSGGGEVVQETRQWDEASGTTKPMRSKEEAMDYRYFPDPDLPPIADPGEMGTISFQDTQTWSATLRDGVREELPSARRTRWQEDLGLTAGDAKVLSSHPGLADFFDATVVATGLATETDRALALQIGKRVANFVTSEVMRDFESEGLDAKLPLEATALAELLVLVHDGTISGKMAKDVYAEMLESGRSAKAIVEERGLAQVSDEGALEAIARKLIEGNPDKVEQYRAGKNALLGWFVGQVMKETRGQANPQMVNQVLRRLLEGEA